MCSQIHNLYNVAISNLFVPELQPIDTKPVIKIKLKAFLSKLEKFKVQTILVVDYKKRNDCKIFDLSAKLIASDSNIDEAFKLTYQSIMTKIKHYTIEDCNVVDALLSTVLRFSSVSIQIKYSIKMDAKSNS